MYEQFPFKFPLHFHKEKHIVLNCKTMSDIFSVSSSTTFKAYSKLNILRQHYVFLWLSHQMEIF